MALRNAFEDLATEATLAERATEATLASVLAALDVALSTRASQSTLASVLTALSSVAVTGPLTDTQLRASAVPVSGTVTATGPLTDTQLRATPVPVSGAVTATGPLTDTQLRASAVPVSAAALPLPSGAATEAGNLATIAAKDFATQATLASVLTELQLKADLLETQPVSAASLPLPSGAASDAGLAALLSEAQLKADLTETQPVSDAVLAAKDFATEATLAELTAAQGTAAGDVVGPMVQGRVSDVAEYQLDGMLAALSLTNDGRLRVASVEARTAVDFCVEDEERMWGGFCPDLMFTGSPWREW
jgi:hypothetical protein